MNIEEALEKVNCELKELRRQRSQLPYPHEKGFILQTDEELLGQIDALYAFSETLLKIQRDPIYHYMPHKLQELKQWIIRDKSLSSPVYSSRTRYVKVNREKWQEILVMVNALLEA